MADSNENGNGPDDNDAKATARKPAQRRSRAQAAKADAAKDAEKAEKSILDSAESFQVIFPTGYSWHVGKDAEVSYEMGPDTVYEDAVDEHVTVPKHGRIRALTLEQLDNFRTLAGQGMLARSFAPVESTTE